MKKLKKVAAMVLTLALGCSVLTGCTFTTTNNLTKSTVDYNTEKIADLVSIPTEEAKEYATALDELSFGKIKTTKGKMVNGNGTYTVGDGKTKYQIIVENSIVTKLQDEDGNVVKDFTETSGGSGLNIQSAGGDTNEPIEPTETPTPSNNGSAQDNLDDIFGTSTEPTQDSDNFKHGTYADITVDDNEEQAYIVPNGGFNDNATKLNGAIQISDLHRIIRQGNSNINMQLFDDIMAIALMDEEFAEEYGSSTVGGFTLFAIAIADKFSDSKYRVEDGYLDLIVEEYRINMTDGTNAYVITIEDGVLINGTDYTDKIINEETLGKYEDAIEYLSDIMESSSTGSTSGSWYTGDNGAGNSTSSSEPYIPTDAKSIGGLKNITTISKFDVNTIERKITNYYSCDIKEVLQDNYDKYDGDYETAYIVMTNGSVCKYFSSSSGTEVYDTTTTYETIWASWQ